LYCHSVQTEGFTNFFTQFVQQSFCDVTRKQFFTKLPSVKRPEKLDKVKYLETHFNGLFYEES